MPFVASSVHAIMVVVVVMVMMAMGSRPDADVNASAVMVVMVMMVTDHTTWAVRVPPFCTRRWSSAFSKGKAFGIGSSRSR